MRILIEWKACRDIADDIARLGKARTLLDNSNCPGWIKDGLDKELVAQITVMELLRSRAKQAIEMQDIEEVDDLVEDTKDARLEAKAAIGRTSSSITKWKHD